DFAHPISDCIEGITHSICTLEFEDHRPLYDWVKYNCGFGDNPRQIEFARLGLTRTIMSKRYLKRLVDTGVVEGWDDPRMPTLSGMRERGYPAEALLDFCDRIGVAKSNSMVEAALLEHCVRENLNANATRVMVVKEPLKLRIVNLSAPITVSVDNNPTAEGAGTHEVTLTPEIFIEKSDFSLDPPPKYHRLKPDGMVRLKGAYIIKYLSHETDDAGNVTAVNCEFIEDSMSGGVNAGIKVKGVLHWAPADALDVVINDYDYLLDEVEDGRDFGERLNPVTKVTYQGKAEPFLQNAKTYDRFQFMRLGYYTKNKKGEYNLIVGLKDSYKG
ncbi:MAG TPA: glutamine--tRNA ligase, partial [Clostridiales bacterium]|nr:glutamine--tRNA ligase [Clostridiales bacterium]